VLLSLPYSCASLLINIVRVLLGYDSNTKAYRVFNKLSGLVEVSSDIVFDETNGSQESKLILMM
jgi:hypothetical protein